MVLELLSCRMTCPNHANFLDSCEKFLWAHREVDLAAHPVIGLQLQVGDAEQFPQAVCLKSLDPLLRVSK